MQTSTFCSTFDILTLSSLMTRAGVAPTPEGMHLFAYIASLLSVYAKDPAPWGYSFAATQNGVPHSSDLETSLRNLLHKAALEQSGTSLKITDFGSGELAAFSELSESLRRNPYLTAAANTALFMPVGLIRTALSREPGLAAFAVRQQAGILLEPGLTTDALHEQLEQVRQAVGTESKDILVPAVGWLSYLASEPLDA